MNEQTRVFIAVLSCMAIFLGWQLLVVKPEVDRQHQTQLAHPAPVQQPAAVAPKPTTPQPTTASESQTTAAAAESRTFTTGEFKGVISNDFAAITSLTLTQYNERAHGDHAAEPVSLVAGDEKGGKQVRIAWQGSQPALHFTATDVGATLEGKTAEGLAIQIEMRPASEPYSLKYVLRARNTGTSPLPVGADVTLALPPIHKEEKKFLAPPADQLHAVCSVQGSVERKQMSDVEKGPWSSPTAVQWVGLDRQYFVAALVPGNNDLGTCTVGLEPDALWVRYGFTTDTLAPGATWEKQFSLYMGPKRDDRLAAVSPMLTDVVDYNIWHIPLGFLARPMVFLLNLFHQWFNSWGVAIMLLTLVVKSLLFPVTYKSVVSMRKMQLLKPELDRIKGQFPDDRERQQMEQLKLFRDKGVNPLGGCLPMLLQMPVWFALYRMLWSAVDLYQQPFLWLPDLTAKEPFPILAILLGGLTIIQQKMTPMATDNQQAKVMMYVMPVMLTMFMIALPSGLVLYILVNSILTIVQQVAINKRAAV